MNMVGCGPCCAVSKGPAAGLVPMLPMNMVGCGPWVGIGGVGVPPMNMVPE
jgi:hypothetical protein